MKTAAIKKTSAVALVLVSIMVSAITVDAQAQIQIRAGASCGQWINQKQQGMKNSHEFWLLGFLSGMAFESNKNILQGTDNDSIFLWMNNYCQTNPLKKITDGAEQLFDELVKQKKL